MGYYVKNVFVIIFFNSYGWFNFGWILFIPMKLYLYRQDIETLNEVCEKEALRIMREIRDTYRLPHKRYISVKAYCKYFLVDRDEVFEAMGWKQASWCFSLFLFIHALLLY